jgi:hypothetical protein
VAPTAELGLELDPDAIRSIVTAISAQRDNTPFDVVKFGMTNTPGDNAIVKASAEAGATWWLECVQPIGATPEDVQKRLRQGPPIT